MTRGQTDSICLVCAAAVPARLLTSGFYRDFPVPVKAMLESSADWMLEPSTTTWLPIDRVSVETMIESVNH